MKKYKLVVIILVFLVTLAFLVGFYYTYQVSPVSRDSEKVIVEIKSGTISSIGDTLYENDLIRSKFIFKIYVKLNGINSLKASTYELDKNMKLSEIIEILEEGNSYNPDEIRITFKEGINVRQIAKLIEENTNNKYEDVMGVFGDSNYIDTLIQKYWFLTDDIKGKGIYYSLEGYLFPDTYAFLNVSVDVKTIIETMLDGMDKQLTKYKDVIDESDLSIHEILTLASIVEKEGKVKDFENVASVFINRLNDKMNLGSCATLYYGMKIDFDEIGIATTAMTKNNNPYNTYMYSGLPIAPISAPSLAAIESVASPKETNYLYFLSDNQGVSYFFKTATEHANKKQQLINENKWYR